MVERGPEKAGVGGSIPSLATIPFNNLALLTNGVKFLARTVHAHSFTHIPLFASLARVTSKFPALLLVDQGRLWLARPPAGPSQQFVVCDPLCEFEKVELER